MPKTVAEVMVDQLAAWGVKNVFGVVGDGIFYLLDALARQNKIKYYAVRHEETAALMASAYAKLTGEVAVCIGTTGPGMVHLLNGLADAQKDRVPVVAITGQVARKDIGTETKQYIDQQSLVQPLVAYSCLLVDPQSTIKVISKAFKSAITNKMASLITVPMDVFALNCNEEIKPLEPYIFTTARSSEETIQGVMGWLDKAERPIILAGVGARSSAQQVVELAEKWGAGVLHTLGGIGVIPGDHPLAIGGLGHAGSAFAKQILKEADICFRIGANWWPMDYIPPNIPIIELDAIAANVGSGTKVAYGLVGKAEEILPQITNSLQNNSRTPWLDAIKNAHRAWHMQTYKETGEQNKLVPPANIVGAMTRCLAKDAIVCLDTGDHTIWFGRNFIPKEQRIILSGKWRTMGFGLPAALACKIAVPTRQIVALVGDGGIGMLLADFTTAVKYNLHIVIIVINNGGLIEEKNRMVVGNLIPEGVYLHNPDFALFAKACGGEGYRIENSNNIDQILTTALSSGKPTIIDVISSDTLIPGTKIS
ncbi:pyruvate oxidase [Desulfotomaculum defluvii]